MSQNRIFGAALVGIVFAHSHAAFAVGAGGAGQQAGPASPPVRTNPLPDGGQSLRQGVVTAVSAKGEQIEIQGRVHAVVAGQTRIFRQGQIVTSEALKKGQTVKFTLTGGPAARPTLGVVYVP